MRRAYLRPKCLARCAPALICGNRHSAHKAGKLVYNGAMPLPASLIASVVSAILETISQTPDAVDRATYENYVNARKLPPEVKQGLMIPPPGDGTIVIGGKELLLSPIAQFRNPKNLFVTRMSIQEPVEIVYLTDRSGAVSRVWVLSAAEVSALPDKPMTLPAIVPD